MADFLPSDLIENVSPDGSDVLVVESSATGDVEKLTLDTLADFLGSPGASVTPVVTASTTAPTIGNGVATMSYQQLGKLVFFYFKWEYGTTTANGSGTYYVDYPVTPHARYNNANTSIPIVGSVLDASGPEFGAVEYGRTVNSSKFEVVLQKQAAGSGSWSSAYPFVWANGDYVSFHGWYEAA